MGEKITTCPKCAGPIERRPGRGRPRIYCGRICRAQGGYEIRRIQRRLQGLESCLSALRQERDDWIRDYQGRTPAQQRKAVEAEIAEAEARLALLLAESRGRPLSAEVRS